MKTEDLKNLRIAIVGGGYGGLSAAIALHHLGADVTVYEQARQIREVGAGIGLRPSSMDRFRQWGVFDAIAKVTSPSDFFEILTATGEQIMVDSWPGMDDYEVKTRTHLVHRNDFIQALLGVLPEGMVHIGHRLETITDHGDRDTHVRGRHGRRGRPGDRGGRHQLHGAQAAVQRPAAGVRR